MHFIDSQVSFFKSYLPTWRPERIKTFLAMIEAIVFSGKTSSTRMAAYFDRNASQKSLRRTIEKFYQFQEINPKDIAKLICAILGIMGAMKLSIDRTNWKNGQTDINYLVLSVEINSCLSIPLFWVSLDKAGNSNQEERCELLDSFIETFGKEAIGSLSGDREFIGEQWFDYLQENAGSFYMRVKSNTLIENAEGKQKHLRTYFEHLKERDSSTLKAEKEDVLYYYHGKRLKNNDLRVLKQSR